MKSFLRAIFFVGIAYLALVLILTLLVKNELNNRKLIYSNKAEEIFVYEFENGKKTRRCLKFSETDYGLLQGCIYTKLENKMALEYQKIMMLGTGFVQDPKSILMLGFGIGTMTLELMDLFPEAKIDIVEISPTIPKIAEEFFGFKPSKNTIFYIQDAYDFVLQNQGKKYDIIFFDAFDASYIPEQFLTKHFFEGLKNLLTENGILIVNTFTSSKTYDQETQLVASTFQNLFQIKRNNRVIFAKLNNFDFTNINLTKTAKEKYDYKKYKNNFETL